MSSSQINLTKSCTSNGKSGCVRGFVRERCHQCHLGSIACEMCHPYPAPTAAESGLAATSTPSTLSFGSSIPWKRPRKTISFTPRRSLTIESSAAVAAAVAEAGVAAPPTPSTLVEKRKPSPSTTPTSISFALNNNSNTNTTTSSTVSALVASSSLSASPPASPSYPNYSAPSSPSFPPTPASSCMFCKSGRKACEECFGLGYVQRVCQDCLRESHYLHRNKRQRRASSTGHNPSRRGSCTTTTTTATTTPPARRKASLPVLSFGSQIETWNQMGVQMEEGWTKFKEQSRSQMEGGWSKFKEQVIAPLTTVARAGSTTATTTTAAAAGGTGIGAAAAAATAAEGAITANESLSAGQEPTLESEPQVPEQLCEDDQEPISAVMATATTTTPSPHAAMATFSNQESGIDMILPCPSTPSLSPHREGSDQKASAVGNIMAAADQQVNSSSNNNKSNNRLSFKAAVKKHLKVRPLFTLHHLKSSKNKNTNTTTTTAATTTIHDNNSIPTGKETRNSKRRRRHWPFPSLLSSSLYRTASSAA